MANVKHVENIPQTQLDTSMAKRKPVKLGWNTEEVEKITHALNSVLANYSVHFQKLRNFHWNVKGSDFFDIHAELEDQYKEALENIDEIAERIRALGLPTPASFKQFSKLSNIKEATNVLSANEMVSELLDDHETICRNIRASLKIVQKANDEG